MRKHAPVTGRLGEVVVDVQRAVVEGGPRELRDLHPGDRWFGQGRDRIAHFDGVPIHLRHETTSLDANARRLGVTRGR